MTPLPYFIPPLDPAARRRIVQAHVIRGLSRWMDAPASSGAHPLDILFLAGVHRQLPLHVTAVPEYGPALHVFYDLLKEARIHEDAARAGTLDWTMRVLARYSRDATDFQDCVATACTYHYTVSSFSLRHNRMTAMKTDDAAKIPADVYARLDSNLASLEATLLARDPMMPQHLRAIHGLIMSYPESVHLLADDEIARIISGAEELTKTQIVSESAKKATVSRAKSMKNVSVDEL